MYILNQAKIRLVKIEKKSYNGKSASVAQLVEQRIRNAWVEGSNPFGSCLRLEATAIKG